MQGRIKKGAAISLSQGETAHAWLSAEWGQLQTSCHTVITPRAALRVTQQKCGARVMSRVNIVRSVHANVRCDTNRVCDMGKMVPDLGHNVTQSQLKCKAPTSSTRSVPTVILQKGCKSEKRVVVFQRLQRDVKVRPHRLFLGQAKVKRSTHHPPPVVVRGRAVATPRPSHEISFATKNMTCCACPPTPFSSLL